MQRCWHAQRTSNQITRHFSCIPMNISCSWQDIAYIHCTAGLGRAPATALGYMLLGQCSFRGCRLSSLLA